MSLTTRQSQVPPVYFADALDVLMKEELAKCQEYFGVWSNGSFKGRKPRLLKKAQDHYGFLCDVMDVAKEKYWFDEESIRLGIKMEGTK